MFLVLSCYRKLQNPGLSDDHRNKLELGQFLTNIFDLLLLNEHDVQISFVGELMPIIQYNE